ncbi:GAF domain-containing protein [Streptomyces amakusaensis]|uniref:Helix-turn-helix domain-containing protein n=1 Tax=Streptomyces amakusaensis TaxID=67271 RepID=A0ABW0ARH4_9ACTN
MSEELVDQTHALTVFELVAREVPRTHLEELLRQAQGTAMPAPAFAALERAVHLGLAIGEATEQRRRREAAMASLIDAAREINSIQDPEYLLSVVTARARRLLGCDVSYVSLPRPEGGSYVHASDGETTMFNVGLEIEEGHGLGEVAQGEGGPLWTADYLGDTAFPRSDRVDEVVRAEGLRAILAVPMRHNGKTVGALYAADRKIRHFTPDEIGLMRSLADLAGTALDRTRLMERVQTDLADVGARRARELAISSRSRFLSEARGKLAGMVLDGCDLRDVATVAGDVLNGSVAVHDAAGCLIVGVGAPQDVDAAVTAKASLDALAMRAPIALGPTLWAAPVIAGAEDLGALITRTQRPLSDEEAKFLHFAGQAVALVLLLQRSTAVAAGPVRDELFDNLLADSNRSVRHLAEQARRVGIDPKRPHALLVIRVEGSEQGRAVVWASSYAHRRSGLKTVRNGCILLLLPGENPSAIAQSVHHELSPLLAQPVSVGAAGPTRDLAAIREVYREAQRCLDALIAIDGQGSAAATEDLGFLGVLLSDDHDVDRYINSTLGAVLDYDNERDTELVRTLDAYFSSHASPTRAAGVLHVHANTVSRRLERLTELLGPKWQEPSDALEIQLALRLLRTRQVLRHRHGPGRRDQADSRDT